MSNTTIPKIEILYEDADVVVVNKPSGLMVHSDGRAKGPFLTDWFLKKFPEAMNVGEPIHDLTGDPISRPGIVHRLDRDTSGALIIAKTAEGHASIKKQFHDRTIVKKYLAFVWGEIKEEFGTISRPIGRDGSDFRKWSAQPGARGELREAETYWTRLAVIIQGNERFSLVEAEPKTGRTHQIRVHLNAVHHPVVGDMLYAPKRPFVMGFTRPALHSRYIEFVDLKGRMVKVVAPLPEDFEHALSECKIDLSRIGK